MGTGEGGTAFDFATCANRTELNEGFDKGMLPGAPWSDVSHAGGSISLDMNTKLTGGALKGNLPTQMDGGAAALHYTVDNLKVAPIAVKLAYSVYLDSTNLPLKAAFYAELGCTLSVGDGDLEFKRESNGLITTDFPPSASFQQLYGALPATGWYDVVYEAVGTSTPTPALTVSVAPHGGGSAVPKSTVVLNAAGHMPSTRLELGCAIPFARSKPTDTTIVVYVDDIKLVVCPGP